MEELVDAMATVGPDNTALLALGVLLDDVAVLAEECAWLDKLDGLVQAFTCGLGHADGIWVGQSLVTNVVCLVQVAVEATVVQRNVDVQDIAILEDSLVGDAVANDFVDRCAYRLGEVAVVERRWVRLYGVSYKHCL